MSAASAKAGASASFRRDMRNAARFALRELRGGLSGFVILIACVALGVGAIGGVNSVADALTGALDRQGQDLLAADIRFELDQRPASGEERAFLEEEGRVSESASLRSMARLPDGSDQSLVELRAVDGAYPLYGSLVTEPQLSDAALFGERDGIFGAAAPQLLMQRLGLSLGDRIELGERSYEIRAMLVREPDAVSEGFAFAPRLMIGMDGLAGSGLIQPGSIVEYNYRVALPAPASDAAIDALRQGAEERFPDAGWSIRSRSNAAPALARSIDRFAQFLTLIGLTALVVGGVGIANAVRAYLEGKRAVIATLRALGASERLIFATYLLQTLAIAALSIAIGLVLALATPFIAASLLAGLLPVTLDAAIQWSALGLAILFGLLTTLTFALPPLGRARDIRAAELFRDSGLSGLSGLPGWRYGLAAAASAFLLAGLAVAQSAERGLALRFLAAVIAAFLVLRLVSAAIMALARRVPSVSSTPLRLAIGNIHRPGALTGSVVLSLGLGLTLLAALGLIDHNLRNQISSSIPERAPNFFFVDIQGSQLDDFTALLRQEEPQAQIETVPMLRGRITALNGVDAAEWEGGEGGRWVLRGDRGLTYSEEVPEGSSIVDGEWWPAGYGGEPLVSFAEEEARELGLGVGDEVTVNVLGRQITARIANLRQVDWRSLSINFVMVFSPNTLQSAPHGWLATLRMADAGSAEEAEVLRAVSNAFPNVTSVRVSEALDIVGSLLGQLNTAIRAAAVVALISSVLVLAGALAAGSRARTHDAVILKMLGATRRTLIGAFALEYGLIGIATAFFALAAGGFASWYVVSEVMQFDYGFSLPIALSVVAIALAVTIGVGLAGTWRILGRKAGPVLRNL